MIFDSHAHLVADDFSRYPAAPLSGSLDRTLDDPMTAERLLGLMDAQGIDKGVAVQRAHVYGYDNRYVCDAAEQYPDRLVAVCCIDATATDAKERSRFWLLERGAVGLRLTEPYKGSGTGWMDAPATKSVWQVAADLGASICLHMYRWNRVETLAALPALLTEFPTVNVVLDHASNLAAEQGHPDYGVDAGLKALARFERVYQKFTAINFRKMIAQGLPLAPVVSRVVREFGAARVMWGSDVAQSAGTYPELIAMASAAAADLGADERRQFLYGTGALLYARQR